MNDRPQLTREGISDYRRKARVRRTREGAFVVVERIQPNGALDWYTYHLTRFGARRAADTYVKTGKVRGHRP